MPNPILILHWALPIKLTHRLSSRTDTNGSCSCPEVPPTIGDQQQLAKDTQHSSLSMDPHFELGLCSVLGCFLDKVTSLLIICSVIVEMEIIMLLEDTVKMSSPGSGPSTGQVLSSYGCHCPITTTAITTAIIMTAVIMLPWSYEH